jgi:predicted transcriptional regulator
MKSTARKSAQPESAHPEYRLLAAGIVSAYVTNNSVPVPELPDIIGRVHAALTQLGMGTAERRDDAPVEQPSSVQIRRSVRPDGIVSFIDGKTYKTLKRHLTSRGLDPRSYRDRYGLPVDYPMVAPRYAEQRSALAKAIGLGQTGTTSRSNSRGRRTAA